MKRTILIAALLLSATPAFAQYDYPGPPMWDRSGPPDVPPNGYPWRHGANPWQPDRFGPRYQTDESLCIHRGDCLDPRRPRMPPFERRNYDWDWGE